MIKLIVTDLDGTLIPIGNGAMDPEVFPVMAALIKEGVKICIATGRQYPCVYKLFGELAEELYYVTNNGADVHHRGEVLELHATEDSPLIHELLDQVQAMPGFDMDVTCPSMGYMCTDNLPLFRFMRDNVGYSEENGRDLHHLPEPIIKLAVHQDGKTDFDGEVARIFREKYGRLFDITASGNGWLDLMPKGVNKGGGVRFIRERLKLRPEEVAVFGDNENDVSMFGEGVSFCMAASTEHVKRSARFVTDDVVKELKKILTEVKSGEKQETSI